MSTLALDDLGTRERGRLGLLPACRCRGADQAGYVARIPVVESAAPAMARASHATGPGADWLETGLHLLRVDLALTRS